MLTPPFRRVTRWVIQQTLAQGLLFAIVFECFSRVKECNSCSIVSGVVSNSSYRLTVHPVTSWRRSSAWHFFLYAKTSNTSGNRVASACLYLNDPATGHECQRNRRKGGVNSVTLGRHPPMEPERRRRGVCVCVGAGVRACARARACVCVCARM